MSDTFEFDQVMFCLFSQVSDQTVTIELYQNQISMTQQLVQGVGVQIQALSTQMSTMQHTLIQHTSVLSSNIQAQTATMQQTHTATMQVLTEALLTFKGGNRRLSGSRVSAADSPNGQRHSFAGQQAFAGTADKPRLTKEEKDRCMQQVLGRACQGRTFFELTNAPAPHKCTQVEIIFFNVPTSKVYVAVCKRCSGRIKTHCRKVRNKKYQSQSISHRVHLALVALEAHNFNSSSPVLTSPTYTKVVLKTGHSAQPLTIIVLRL